MKFTSLLAPTVLFPFAAAINFFSVTGLLVFAGLLGQSELAADIAVTQGAVIAVFFSLSGNARNLILANNSSNDNGHLFYFRIIIILPAALAAFLLANSIIDIPLVLILGLILRKCTEWIIELELANREKSDDSIFAIKYILVNAFGFSLLIISLAFSWLDLFYIILFVWALLPATFLYSYVQKAWNINFEKSGFIKLFPHIGSSAVIGVTMFIFRIMLITLVGKVWAGQMFTAYAIGGLASSIYTHAIGPTVVLRRNARSSNMSYLYFLLCILVGILIWFSAPLFHSEQFLYGIGFSIIGGGVMLLAQQQRLHLLQGLEKDVFTPDALINILFIASVPFAYYLFGQHILVVFFLWSALLNLSFYWPLAYKHQEKIIGKCID